MNSTTIVASLVSLFSGIFITKLFLSYQKNKQQIKDEDTKSNNQVKFEQEQQADDNDDDEPVYDEEIGDCKQVLVIRTDLSMTKGKIIAQCCHATLGAYQKSLIKNKKVLKQWEYFGAAKITVKANSENELYELREKAKKAGLVSYLVLDAGHTQIPSGSATVLAIGPAPHEKVNEVTGHLKLY
ncbi:hypothetical protein CYY_004050 [Polysphondylium violaceum]|uniref:peptidyl-tRNA hydrolase n=1 Tax=Polysphondylium violaceum TaxID=133409 RepID=A0A8J4UZM5_9MYCE|nr:hypothetical protein CYY_004050 [Polysphondylium violaceum]